MPESPTTPNPPPRPPGLVVHFRNHARGLSVVAVASVLGILAAFAFQVLTARYLGAADFGLLASFLVIVNVAAIGSSALQNSVTVRTASDLAGQISSDVHPRRRRPVDALVLGAGGALVVAALAPWIAGSLGTSPSVVVGAAVTIPLSFVFADSVGLLQGSGQVSRAVWWSTLSQLFRVVFAIIVVVIGVTLWGIIGAVLAALVVAVIGATWSARSVPRPRESVMSRTGMTIIVLTVAFAWLTSSDVLFLRAGGPADLAGYYAAVTVLVKTGFLLPATLSLYLLPRFVRNRENLRLSRLGVLVTLGLSVATSAAMILVFALFGGWIMGLLYGNGYAPAIALLAPTALAYLPWIAAQGVLIKITSSASIGGAIAIAIAVGCQWAAFALLVPDVYAMLVAQGVVGALVLAAFLLIDLSPARRSRVASN